MGMAFSGSGAPDLAGSVPAERRRAPDRVLVVAFQQGDRDAFDEIYRRYRGRAELVCRRYLPTREDAEEAAQETMMRVLRGLPALAGDYAVRAWVDRIAANVALDVIRARARRPPTDPPPGAGTAGSGDHAGPAGDPCEVVEAMVRSRAVRATLDALPEPHRAALVLREVEGRSHVEIGHALGISSCQAKALVHRARRRFRQSWGDERQHRLRALLPLLLPARLRQLLDDLLHPSALPRAASALGPPATAAAGPAEHLATAAAALVLLTGVAGPFLGPPSTAPGPPGAGAPAQSLSPAAPAAPAPPPPGPSPVSPAPAVHAAGRGGLHLGAAWPVAAPLTAPGPALPWSPLAPAGRAAPAPPALVDHLDVPAPPPSTGSLPPAPLPPAPLPPAPLNGATDPVLAARGDPAAPVAAPPLPGEAVAPAPALPDAGGALEASSTHPVSAVEVSGPEGAATTLPVAASLG